MLGEPEGMIGSMRVRSRDEKARLPPVVLGGNRSYGVLPHTELDSSMTH